MRKYIKINVLLFLGVIVLLNACKTENDPVNEQVKITVQAAVTPEEDGAGLSYDSFVVEVISERTGQKQEAKLNKDGKVELVLDKGSYSVTINGLHEDIDYFGTLGMAQYGADQTLKVNVKRIVGQYNGGKSGLVIKEIFYNGGTYNGKMQHPDQYIVIANNSDKLIYVDGLVIAQASNMNSMPNNLLTDLLPYEVAVANMYQIPGSGKEYGLKPNDVYVIARLAINHAETLEHNPDKDTGIPVDLSGADFELVDGDAYKWGSNADGDEVIVDNPEVPNLIKISNDLPGGVTGWMHPYAIRPIFIFDGSAIKWDEFKKNNRLTYNEKPNAKMPVKEVHGYKISAKLVVDAIESTSEKTPYWGNFTSKSLPENVDKGVIQGTISGCHHSTFMFRVTEGGKLKDTNDSKADVKIEHRPNFKGYPKGWRNK